MTFNHTPAHSTTHPDRFEDEETGIGYDVYQDTDAEDPRTWIGDEEKVAVYVFDGPRGDKDSSVPENIAAQAFVRFYELWDAQKSLEATRRWLAAFHPETQYDLAVSTIRGHSQGDWAEVFAASIIDFVDPRTGTASPGYGTAQGHIDQYSSWRWGDVWTVSPDSGESLSGIYAEFPEDALKQYLADNPPSEETIEPEPDEAPAQLLDTGLLAPDFEAPGLKRWTTGTMVIVAVLPEDVAKGPVHAARTASLLRRFGDVGSRAVLVDLRAVDAWAEPVHAYADALCAWLAEGLPERLIVLGTAVPLEKRLEGTAASLLALRGLDEQGSLWLVEHQDDLVTDLPDHSPLDAALFEEFVQHEQR